jgi:hypothetical protein
MELGVSDSMQQKAFSFNVTLIFLELVSKNIKSEHYK